MEVIRLEKERIGDLFIVFDLIEMFFYVMQDLAYPLKSLHLSLLRITISSTYAWQVFVRGLNIFAVII